MDTQTLIIICYIFSVPLSIFNLFFMPRKGTLSQYMENLRRNSAIIGFIPCGPLSLIMVAIGASVYYLRVKSIASKEQSLAATFNMTGSPRANEGNPFGGSSTPTGGATAANPFQQSGGATPPPSASNPFTSGTDSSDPGGSGDSKPGDNPFA